jgi:hypothetical protein
MMTIKDAYINLMLTLEILQMSYQNMSPSYILVQQFFTKKEKITLYLYRKNRCCMLYYFY